MPEHNEAEEFRAFYNQYVFESERIGIVDLGWNGTFQVALERAFPNKVFKGYYLGLLPHNEIVRNKNGYLFSPESPKPANFSVTKNYIDVLEMLLCSDEGSLISLKCGVHREVVGNLDKLRNLIARGFQNALTEYIVQNYKALRDQGYKIESLNNLGTYSPEWFIKGMAVLRHKIGPSDAYGQPLFISSRRSMSEANRIWWPIGQKRYLSYLRSNNLLRFLVITCSYRLTQFFFILRVLGNSQDRKKVLSRLRNSYPK
jgi:hypothetical protein